MSLDQFTAFRRSAIGRWANRALHAVMIAAERRALIELPDAGTIGDDVMATVQRELDFEQILLEGSQPVVESPREAVVERS